MIQRRNDDPDERAPQDLPTPFPPSETDGSSAEDAAARAAIAPYLGRIWHEENQLAQSLLVMAERHERDAHMHAGCRQLAEWSDGLVRALEPFVERYGRRRSEDAEYVGDALFHGSRWGGMGLLLDAQDLALLAEDVRLGWAALEQAAPELRDMELEALAVRARATTERQIRWLESCVTATAARALTGGRGSTSSLPRRWSPSSMPQLVWAPLASGVLVLAIGALSVAARAPLLAVSLGPTAVLHGTQPAHPSGHPWNVFVGHAIGFASGVAGAWTFGVWSSPSVLGGGAFTSAHAAAATLAVALTVVLGGLARASHPPAAATALLVAFGALHARGEALAFVAGAALVALLGEGLRRLRVRTVAPRA